MFSGGKKWEHWPEIDFKIGFDHKTFPGRDIMEISYDGIAKILQS